LRDLPARPVRPGRRVTKAIQAWLGQQALSAQRVQRVLKGLLVRADLPGPLDLRVQKATQEILRRTKPPTGAA
jgi:hypothetical protein